MSAAHSVEEMYLKQETQKGVGQKRYYLLQLLSLR